MSCIKSNLASQPATNHERALGQNNKGFCSLTKDGGGVGLRIWWICIYVRMYVAWVAYDTHLRNEKVVPLV